MSKNLREFAKYFAVFWIVTDFIPGLTVGYDASGKTLLAAMFVGVVFLTPLVFDFFKIMETDWSQLIFGSVLNFIYIYLVSWLMPKLLTVGAGYIGGGDFIIFTLPRLVTLPNPLMVIALAAIVLQVCCIMLGRLR